MLDTNHELNKYIIRKKGLHFFFQRYNRFVFCDIVLWIKTSTHFLDILSKRVEFELTHLTRNDPNSPCYVYAMLTCLS